MSISITSTLGFATPLFLLENSLHTKHYGAAILFGTMNLLSGLNDLRTKQKLVITTKTLDTEDVDGKKELLCEKKVYNSQSFSEFSATQIAIGGAAIVLGLLNYQDYISTDNHKNMMSKLIIAGLTAEIFSYFMLETNSEILQSNDSTSSIAVIDQDIWGNYSLGYYSLGNISDYNNQ